VTVPPLEFERMDIRCIRLHPYDVDGRLMGDVTQVIPLPGASRVPSSAAPQSSGTGSARPPTTRLDHAFGGSGSRRWGDYSTAVSDPSGTVWMGTGYISGIERTFYANWATYIAHVTP
jgi:hypothetical protein